MSLTAPIPMMPGILTGPLASPAGGGALAGFESLLAGLFGTPAGAAPAIIPPQGQAPFAPVAPASEKEPVSGAAKEAEGDDAPADPDAPAEPAFLALTMPPVPLAPTPAPQGETPAPAQAPPARAATPHPDSARVAAEGPEVEAPDTETPAPVAAQPTGLARADRVPSRPAPLQASGRPAPSAAPALAALSPAPTPDADPAIPQVATPVSEAPATALADQPPPAAAALAAPALTPPPTPVRATHKGERAKPVPETAEVTASRAAATPRPAANLYDDLPVDTAAAEPETPTAAAEPATPDQPDLAQAQTRAAAAADPPAAPATPLRATAETVATLAAQVVKKLEGRATRFDLELAPDGLGRVDVRIEIAAQGRVTAVMTFDNPQAAADLRGRAAELHRSLEQAGFDLSGGIAFDVAGDRGQARQEWRQPEDQTFGGRAFKAALDNAGEADQAASVGALRLRRGVTGGVDLRI